MDDLEYKQLLVFQGFAESSLLCLFPDVHGGLPSVPDLGGVLDPEPKQEGNRDPDAFTGLINLLNHHLDYKIPYCDESQPNQRSDHDERGQVEIADIRSA
jgi:hypothetical protein